MKEREEGRWDREVQGEMDKVAERLGNRASYLKVASLIPGRAK